MADQDPYAAIAQPAQQTVAPPPTQAGSSDPYAQIAKPMPVAPEGFWHSAYVQTPLGIITHAIAHPIETLNTVGGAVAPLPGEDWAKNPIIHAINDRIDNITSNVKQAAKDAMNPESWKQPNNDVGGLVTGLPKNVRQDLGRAVPVVGSVLAKAQSQYESGDKAGAAGTLAGTVASFAAPEGFKATAAKAVDVAAAAPEFANEGALGVAQRVLGVDSSLTARAVEDANNTYAEKMAQRPGELKQHYDDVQAAKKANAQIQSRETPEGFTSDQSLQDRKQALIAGQKRLVSTAQDQLQALAAKTKAQADQNYAQVNGFMDDAKASAEAKAQVAGENAPVNDPSALPANRIAQAVDNAYTKIRGSSESIKIFKDIASKYPASAPDTIMYQGAEIPKGHPLYDVLNQGQLAQPIQFSNLQGYYSELGDLMGGQLPGDVYQAVKTLRSNVGNMMQEIAANVDKQRAVELGGKLPPEESAVKSLKNAQQFYSQYMTDFREPTGPSGSGSPVAKALDAKDPDYVIDPFTGKSGFRGIETIAKYDPELARRFRTLAKVNDDISDIGSAPTQKPLPELPPQPQGEVPDVRGLKSDKLESIAANSRTWSKFDTAALATSVAAPFLGHWQAIFAEPALLGLRKGIAATLDLPAVRNWLSTPRAADIAALDKLTGPARQEAQQNIINFVTKERKAGQTYKLDPAVVAFLGSSGPAQNQPQPQQQPVGASQ